MRHLQLGQQYINHLGNGTQPSAGAAAGGQAGRDPALPRLLPAVWISSRLETAQPGSLLEQESHSVQQRPPGTGPWTAPGAWISSTGPLYRTRKVDLT